ncbi:MAG TPA: GH92 family glycosyl hydrolase [bacterium]|jgi:putative alpha-1,2-mannosidase
MKLITLLFLVCCCAFMAAARDDLRPVDYVNPMIGTNGHGHTYPGASLPFGMVQLSPDGGTFGWDWCSGYHYSDTTLVGFSHTHLSGTGCADLGDILLTPTLGEPRMDSLIRCRFSHDQEHAKPGFYAVKLLDHNIDVDLTATKRAGFHRYTFPKSDSACVVVDVNYGNDDTPLERGITLEDSVTVSGYRTSAGWAREQHVYFVAKFSKPFFGSWMLGRFAPGKGEPSRPTREALYFSTRDGAPLLVKVGISAVSVEGARKNLAAEIPNWDFDGVKLAANDAWQKELGTLDVESKSQADKATFYTALYHTMLAPTLFDDVDGQYRGGDGKVHQAKGFDNYCTFSLWDTYRAAHPLYTIFQPDRVADFVNSMLAFYRDGGLLPVWPLTGNETWCMIGYHSIPVIADAFFKGFKGFDPKEAFDAMKKSATQNKRGLEYYNLVTPASLSEKLTQLQREQVNTLAAGESSLPAGTHILKGWAKTLSGEEISYHSSYPYVTQARISRATTGGMEVKWETEPVPVFKQATPVTFMWAAGVATGKGGHEFRVYVNNKYWLSFGTAQDTSRTQWTVRGDNGAELTFVPQRRDRYDDLFGNMFLTANSRSFTPGKPVTLVVVGEKGNSPDWYMTFEHSVTQEVRVEPEYALAEESGKPYQFLKVMVEHSAPPVAATVSLNGKSMQQVNLKTGLNTFELPIEAVASSTQMKVAVNAAGNIVEKDVTVPPVKPYGYIPADKERESVSKALEYAYDDWCIAQMAKSLGKTGDYDLFSKRALYYRNLYDSTSGFMRGRNSDGSWVSPFNPRFGTEKQPQYTEGNAWQYSWYVPQDVPGLISLMGGKQKFSQKLDSLFHQSPVAEDEGAPPDVTGLVGLYAQGNEPSHHIAYLYNFAGQPWKTQEIVHRICRDYYTDKPDGLCGNEDCGQMSAWYVLSAMGFYPVNPADGTYQLGTPLLDKVSIHVGKDKTFTVTAKNVSDKNIYVQSVSLNGKPLTSTFITHNDIISGGTLAFIMGPVPNKSWGTEREAEK